MSGSVDSSRLDAACLRLPDGTLVDLAGDPPQGAEVVYQQDDAGREVLRHSAAHVLAQAVIALWPDAKYAIGPPIQDPPGFYYDFDIGRPFTPEDLERIEAKMAEIVEQDQVFRREEVSLDEALRIFADQPYKREILEGIGDESYEQGVAAGKVSLYRNDGSFVDLCRGPHLPSTGRIRALRLTKTSGAYWRGDEERPMLQRIYGTAWESREALEDYLRLLEEAERRDHVKLGRELELFMTHELVGGGLPMWLPKGATVRRLLEEYILEEERRAGYTHVYTPHLGKRELYEISGHWDLFRESMFPSLQTEHEELVLKPMNCPHHILIYASKLRSYRDLPIRIAELGAMYRYERSGTLRGLLRVRTMTLNDAHIFCRPDQVREEFRGVVNLLERAYAALGITAYSYRLSLHDPEAKEKYVDRPDMWEPAERQLREALDELGLSYTEAPGEAAFYGPKLDVQLRDILGREETVSTVQLDFLLPERFGLRYIGSDGAEHRPVMIHRGVIGTLERMVAYLIDLYAGAFPTWLAPVQAIVIPIADRHHAYAAEVESALAGAGVRVEVDASDETLNNRIRKAQGQKVPYMLIVGDREVEARSVSCRSRTGEENRGQPLQEFVDELLREIEQRGAPEGPAPGKL